MLFLVWQAFIYIPIVSVFILIIYFQKDFEKFNRQLVKIDLFFNTQKRRCLLYLFSISLSLLIGLYLYSIPTSSDVQIAILGAVRAFLKGENPFVRDVVPHILVGSCGSENFINGTYNYGPVDLIFYSIGYIIFSPFFGSNFWFLCTNLTILIGIYFFIREIITFSDIMRNLTFALIFSIFLKDNVVLMCFFLSLAWFVQVKVNSKYKSLIVTFILSLGILTKMFIAFVLVGYFFYILKANIKLWIINILIDVSTMVLVTAPFGVLNVIKSIFLFNVNLGYRSTYATIQGGITIYLLLFNLQWLYIPLALILTFIFLFFSDRFAKNQMELKFTLFTLLSLLILPNSNFSLFMIPIFFYFVHYFKNIYLKDLEPVLDIKPVASLK